MKKQYFAWKDGIQAVNGPQEWVELLAKEFCELEIKIRTGQISPKRYFACVPPAESGDVYYYFECTYEQFLDSEKKRIERLRKAIEEQEMKEKGLWYDLISLDCTYQDDNGDELSLHDMIADPNAFFEERLINSILLRNALSFLTREERTIINVFYLNDKTCTEREYASANNLSKTSVHYQKKKILKKLKSFLDQN